MAVIGTNCQICGLPVQQDHYVSTGSADLMRIYRGRPGQEIIPPAFPFNSQHDWLKEVLALPLSPEDGSVSIPGEVQDGHWKDHAENSFFVSDGVDERAAIHKNCWILADKPQSYRDIKLIAGLYSLGFLKHYQQQLFDFVSLQRDKKSWMLADPLMDSEDSLRNKERIKDLVQSARDPKAASWGYFETNQNDIGGYYRFRRQITASVDKTGYPHLFWIEKELLAPVAGFAVGEELEKLEAIETSLHNELERNEKGIYLATISYQNKIIFVFYVSDPQQAQASLDQIIGAEQKSHYNVSIESDPQWQVYFNEIYPNLLKTGTR